MSGPAATVLAASRVVTSGAVHAPGWVAIEGDTIVGLGAGRPQRIDRDLGAAILVPGFVDIHVHGGGGGSYADGSVESALRARDAHRAHGTTTTLASLVTAAPAELLAGVRMLAALAADGEVGGIHLEGPWLSPARAGAHAPALLRDPDPGEIDALLAAGDGAIRMVTIAPELRGGLDAVRRFVDAGVTVAIGHTDADHARTRAAIDAGATVATHLCNAMRPVHHREPGPVVALMRDQRVTLELISDGVHLHPALVEGVEAAVGADRVALVTDAMGAAGCGDGRHRLGALDVEVRGGIARVLGTDTIAGSTVTMDAVFRRRALRDPAAVAGAWGSAALAEAEHAPRGAAVGLERNARSRRDLDAALIAAARQTASNPARAIGWERVGDIAPGRRADFAVLDPELRVTEVIVGGAAPLGRD
ncbi:N-acetylglucosamine-6-phosphate deacetylase [Leucobacter sp. CSA1]|uniref:N-acetylglucosamine-6-phosphate deacetylase n=1 Tax=Leucobacter chromiisoli TaxID=2796471 RepID=A0A934UW26_9MICO|nr:N-acetylglucosamine-6-phosphate deacetylase [Leucobacter chromiisoli]MBK0419492.1 N-acetylglucosamine-6-phosphate deacetylase [Leucobacter chromiisoli]